MNPNWKPGRRIEIFCDRGPRHPEIEIGVLGSEVIIGIDGTSAERWEASGPHVTVENDLPPQLGGRAAALRHLAAAVAGRYRFRCPHCSLDVIAGDRFGGKHTRIGFDAFVNSDSGLDQMPTDVVAERVAISAHTDALLTRVADSGESRLSLAALGRILGA